MFVAANTANPFCTGRLKRVGFFFSNRSFLNVGKLHYFFVVKIFVAKRRVRRKVNGLIFLDKGADAVERVAGGGHVFKHDGQFIFQQSLIGVGNVAMNQIGNVAVLNDNDTVALCVTRREDVINAVGNLLAFVEFLYVPSVKSVRTTLSPVNFMSSASMREI